MDKIKVTVTCSQKDEKGKKFFEVVKTDTLKSGKVDNFNLSKFIINLLFLSIDLSKLTNSNRPKLSKPIEVQYNIAGKTKVMNVKFSLSEKRIEILSEKLPGIFLQSNRLYQLNFKNERFTNHNGTMVFAEIKPKARKKLAKVAVEN